MYELDLEIEDVDPRWIKLIKYFHKFWKEKFWEKSHFTYENRFDNVHVFLSISDLLSGFLITIK